MATPHGPSQAAETTEVQVLNALIPTLPIALWRIVNWRFLPIKHSKVAKALPAMLLLYGFWVF